VRALLARTPRAIEATTTDTNGHPAEEVESTRGGRE
jgi:hypothetical protein